MRSDDGDEIRGSHLVEVRIRATFRNDRLEMDADPVRARRQRQDRVLEPVEVETESDLAGLLERNHRRLAALHGRELADIVGPTAHLPVTVELLDHEIDRRIAMTERDAPSRSDVGQPGDRFDRLVPAVDPGWRHELEPEDAVVGHVGDRPVGRWWDRWA